MKLYTKTGDSGETGLFDGSRVPKDHPRVCAYGAVDALNSFLGSARAVCTHDDLAAHLEQIQRELFDTGADLATPEPAAGAAAPPRAVPRISAAQVVQLEHWIDEACDALPPLRSFILPGGCELACRIHLARAACRDAERLVVALQHSDRINHHVLLYLNRLGDLLFAWARLANARANVPDTIWSPRQ